MSEPVLVVDDEEDMGWAMQTVLAAEGQAAVLAASAREALALAAARPFTLAFVDLKLGDADGLELITRLRTARPELACVLMSGFLYPDDEPIQAALADGRILAFIGKPFLLDQVRAVLAQARLR